METDVRTNFSRKFTVSTAFKCYTFDTFIEITKPYMNDPSISDFVKQLDPIAKVYAGLSTSLTETNIKDITKAITGIREQIVQ